ncbi:LysM peptidoglycan-binding domain-containing protein [Bradyrhizobium manausense]|uniref:LysM peptidoglycan-binding domain-containing protein n=1 Tax=Bradyrhizobium TaxID=374 RepID=UPI001BABA60E|nr:MULTISPECIES: LysM peptidoglycan-binding domain-containing protein [Bradyrhizobium]MBR0824570.1 LysM peptidoglycan-binding domain-containing protein [Bradyrhizobium manausense]UVO29640.1 LysM peptidoglycan-binding domain-containing protein [Bradyrhizobium arachidis]
MVIASKAVIGALSCLAVAAGGTAFVYYGTDIGRAPVDTKREAKAEAGSMAKAEVKPVAKAETKTEAKVDTKPDASTPRNPQIASAAPDAPVAAQPPKSGSAAVAALGEAKSALADLPAAAPPPVAEDSGPRFDVARVDEDGEAVIAGRAAPGARVDLLRDGEKHDTVTADASGLFVMTPPKLPPGNYKLTLKSTAPDGAVAQSKAGVPVALNAPPAPGRADLAKAAQGPAKQAAKETTKESTAAKDESPTGALALAAAPPAEKGPLRAKIDSTGSTASSRVVSRGDSLWMISRRTYGDGAAYALIYNANRDKIHDPDRIYPGQTFVLPRKGR